MLKKFVSIVLFILFVFLSYGNNVSAQDRGTAQENSVFFPYGWVYEGAIYNVNPGYYGGLKEFKKWIPQLKDLGIKTIYLLPIWSDSSYTPDDYYKISLKAGTEQALKDLVAAVHKYDMKILLDLVTGYSRPQADNFIYNNHLDWHMRDNKGQIMWFYPNRWGPAIDRSNPEVIKYFTDVAKYYVQEYDIDGWRIDAPQNNWDPEIVPGDHSAMELLRQIKKAITSIKPDAILLAEVPGPRCEGDAAAVPLFDEISEISYDWFLMGQTALSENMRSSVPESVKNAILRLKNRMKNGEKPDSNDSDVRVISKWSIENYGIAVRNKMDLRKVQEKALISGGSPGGFAGKVIKGMASSEEPVNFFKTEKILYNRSRARWFENHDTHARTMLAYPDYWRNFLVLISTVPGVPFIHAGQETGETKADYISGAVNEEVWNFYKKVFSVRARSRALKYGAIENIGKAGDNIYVYLRSYKNESVIVAVNFLNREVVSILDLSFLPKSVVLYDELNNEEFTVEEPDNFRISVSAYGARILMRKDKPGKL